MPQTINGVIWPAAGDLMKFIDENGYPHQLEEARKLFAKDQVLTVKTIEVDGWSNFIEFEQRPGKRFNGVMFEPVSYELPTLVEVPATEPAEIEVDDENVTFEFSSEERDTILAALRLWQDQKRFGPDARINEDLIDIATNGGQHEELSLDAIDALCEAINV